jgi:hypothetical protein
VFLTNAAVGARWAGDWDWSLAQLDEQLARDLGPEVRINALAATIQTRALRGDSVDDLLAELEQLGEGASDRQVLASITAARAAVVMSSGDLVATADAYRRSAALNTGGSADALSFAARAALRAGDAASAEADLSALAATGMRGPAVDARGASIRAGLAALGGRGAEALALYRDAIRGFRDAGLPLDEGLTGIEMAMLLDPALPEVRAAVGSARETLLRLRATPLIEQLDAATGRSARAESRPTTRPGVGQEATPRSDQVVANRPE